MNDAPKITPRTAELLETAAVAAVHRPAVSMAGGNGGGPAPVRDPLRPQKVAIIGTAPSSRLLAPFGDPEWTIWGSSPGNMNNLPRVDAWIEVHSNFLWPEYVNYGGPYVKWLGEVPFPVLAADKTLFPKAGDFPWQKLVSEFGPYFFTSTFAWMMAYAIHVGVKEMALYGVDMASRDEYILQLPGGHHFILEAKKRGIRVVVPPESDLIQPPPLYGIADSHPFGRKSAARRLEVRGRINAAEQRLQQAQGEITYLKGAEEDVDYFQQRWGSLPYAHLWQL